MSKAEILEELPKLTKIERHELLLPENASAQNGGQGLNSSATEHTEEK